MSGIQIIFGYPWVGVLLFGCLVGYWSVVFVVRRKKGSPIPSGEWIVYALGWLAVAFFLTAAIQQPM